MSDPEDFHDIISLQEHTARRAASLLGARSWTELLTIQPPDWLVPGLLQERALHVLTSDSGCGKTWLALDLFLSGIYGSPVLGQRPTKPFNSIYLAADSPDWDIAQQLRKLLRGRNASPDTEPESFILPIGFLFDREDHLAVIAELAKTWHIKAMFIDVMLYSHEGDENDNSYMARMVLKRAKLLRDQCGMAIFFVHHNAKGLPGMTGMYRGAGTIIQAAEHHITLAKKKKQVLLTVEKIRGDEIISSSLLYSIQRDTGGGRALVLSPTDAADSSEVPDSGALAPEQTVLSFLQATGSATRAAVKFHFRNSQPRWVDNQLQLLKSKNLIKKVGRAWVPMPESPSATSSPTTTAPTRASHVATTAHGPDQLVPCDEEPPSTATSTSFPKPVDPSTPSP